MKKSGWIISWYKREIRPELTWEREIDAHINTADIVLLLISAAYMDSDYAYGIEMQRALQRHNANEARVIPVILRPCDWSYAPFTSLQCLPRDGKAITLWDNQDLAWNDVTAGIRQVIEDHPFLPTNTPQTTLPPI